MTARDQPAQRLWAEAGVRRLMDLAVPDSALYPELAETPGRVVRAFKELTAGYQVDVPALFTTFASDADEMVVLSGIRVVSLCEHHLLPFTGTATVGYVPDGKVVGVSKLARVVDAYARRLQIQERLTQQVAGAIAEHLNPKGVGVIVRAHHACMGVRGVEQPNALMTTSAMLGVLRTKPEARAEFLAFAHDGPRT